MRGIEGEQVLVRIHLGTPRQAHHPPLYRQLLELLRAEGLAGIFKAREGGKESIALVWGGVRAGRRIEADPGRDPANRKRMSTRARRARSAVTRVTRAERLKGLHRLRREHAAAPAVAEERGPVAAPEQVGQCR